MTTPTNTDGLFELWIEDENCQPCYHSQGSYAHMSKLYNLYCAAGRLCWLERAKDEQEEGL